MSNFQTPFISELEAFRHRTAQQQSLNSLDLELLNEFYLGKGGSSEMANMISQIWQLIQRLPINTFWNSLLLILSNMKSLDGKIIALKIFENKIEQEWFSYTQNQKSIFSQFVLNNIDELILGQYGNTKQRDILLKNMNYCLVIILKKEKKGLFHDFITHFQNEGLSLPYQKVSNYFSILKMVIQNGEHQIESQDGFKETLNEYMRQILKIICNFMSVQHPNKIDLMTKCLQIFKEILEYVPGYEIFNCNIIQSLIEYASTPQFHYTIFSCLQLIFNFQENIVLGHDYHTKIAKKLLYILNYYLDQIQKVRKVSQWNNDKESESTYDSRQTKKNNNQSLVYNQFLILLYLFLKRYVPFMDKTPEENELEVQYESSIKIYFSEELYGYLTSIYQKILCFIEYYLRQYVYFNLQDQSDNDIENQYKVMISIKLMVVLLQKIKITNLEPYGNIIQLLVLELTPIPLSFQYYYARLNLIQYQDELFQDNITDFMQEYYHEYRQTLKTILDHPYLSNLYLNILIKKIEAVQNDNKLGLNIINRVSWSLVYAYEMNGQRITKDYTITLLALYVKCTNKNINKDMKRCFSMNNKYICLAYRPDIELSLQLLFSTLTVKSELVLEFIVIILSKVLMNERIMFLGFGLKDINMLVVKIGQIEAGEAYQEGVKKIYAGIYNVLIKITDNVNAKGKGDGTLKNHIQMVKEVHMNMFQKEMKRLEPFVMGNQPLETVELGICLKHFQKILELSKFFIDKFHKNIIKNSTELHKGYHFLLKIHQNYIYELILKLQQKNNIYFCHLNQVKNEYYELKNILKFKSKYIDLVQSFIHLNILKSKIQAQKNQEKPLQKKRQANKTKQQQFIKKTIDNLKSQFKDQQIYKSQSFFKCIRMYHLYLLQTKEERFLQIINNQTEYIIHSLHESEESLSTDFLKSKFIYFDNIITSFLFHFSPKLIQYFINVIKSIRTNNYESSHYQIVFQLLVNMVNEMALKMEMEEFFASKIWSYYLDIFITIFQLFFDLKIKNNVFGQLALVFFKCIRMAKRMPFSLRQNGKYGSNQYTPKNVQILLIFLDNHTKKFIKFNGNEQEQNKKCLEDLLSEQNESYFGKLIKQYVYFIDRITTFNVKNPQHNH